MPRCALCEEGFAFRFVASRRVAGDLPFDQRAIGSANASGFSSTIHIRDARGLPLVNCNEAIAQSAAERQGQLNIGLKAETASK